MSETIERYPNDVWHRLWVKKKRKRNRARNKVRDKHKQRMVEIVSPI